MSSSSPSARQAIPTLDIDLGQGGLDIVCHRLAVGYFQTVGRYGYGSNICFERRFRCGDKSSERWCQRVHSLNSPDGPY